MALSPTRLKPEKEGSDTNGMKLYLDELALKYNSPEFILNDPISVPHRYAERHDIECSAFLISTIAWGRRDLIIRSGSRLMAMMDDEPYKFILGASEKELRTLDPFVHRTFNGVDAVAFIRALRNIYCKYDSLEGLVHEGLVHEGSMKGAIMNLRMHFFEAPHPARTERHVSDVSKGSAGKKINMFLRWMVRRDDNGVDFGLWKSISPSELYIPLDVHAGNTARRLGLLQRKQNDWRAAEELTMVLRGFDRADPVKYDFALFGAGVNGVI